MDIYKEILISNNFKVFILKLIIIAVILFVICIRLIQLYLHFNLIFAVSLLFLSHIIFLRLNCF